MALLNVSSDWLDADGPGSYMLLRNGDDFDLHLHPAIDSDSFYKTEKLLDVITPEGHICRVVLSRKNFYSNLEVAYVLKIDRGSRNCLMNLPKEVRRMIFEPCLQYDRYAPRKTCVPAPAALQWWSRPKEMIFNSPANLEEVLGEETEYTLFGVPFQPSLPSLNSCAPRLSIRTLHSTTSI
ncbi:hypothetical protein KC343_g133 [Hortaea werneckii]|nr:hypothetical protein KC352_g1243 [Hortaea werneckii]KAI7573130.1 hypothetical protein KC317_g153 [Hortaea werneckii]KAI7628528.1 hypothetical protein KC346_g129 [Hortaea werneckii]KAI7638359.1 hypothetical protein KC343_g133 [Hortaea werneckii]KAI7683991.1 hypothetical protein KC319_g160 [Hortaea werneckii]